MRKFDLQVAGWMFGLSIVLWAMIATAGPEWKQKPIQCASPPEVMDNIEDQDMVPLMQLNGNITKGDGNLISAVPYILFYNQDTEYWYFVEFTSYEEACVVGVGQGINFSVKSDLDENGPPKKEGT